MRAINWLISMIFGLYVLFIKRKKSIDENAGRSNTSTSEVSVRYNRSFDQDYRDATILLRDRLDDKYPDGQYARLRSESNTPYDNGESRIEAVDRMSAAIASALRKGASVRQAAEAGAAVIGI